MASHDVKAVYFTKYLSVLFQLTYLDKLYGECNGTARACGYQVLFSTMITKSAWERGYISLSVLGKVTRRAERTFEGMPALISYMRMYAVLTRGWGLI